MIPAIGQIVESAGLEALLEQRAYLHADAWGRVDGHPGVLTGGDARGDRGTVSEAIGDGRRAAGAIDAYIRAVAEPADSETKVLLNYDQLNLDYFAPAPRPVAPTLAVVERDGSKEIDGGLPRQQVVAEGQRCFSCGNCLACDNCWTLCPDVAVLKTRKVAADGSHYVFDYGYCKGCGLCAHECPTGYIVMQEEP